MLSDALEMLRRHPELRQLQKLFIYTESDQLDHVFQAVALPQAGASDNL